MPNPFLITQPEAANDNVRPAQTLWDAYLTGRRIETSRFRKGVRARAGVCTAVAGAALRPGALVAGRGLCMNALTPFLVAAEDGTPPANLELEQEVLAGLIARPEAFASVQAILAPEHFFEPLHAATFEAIRSAAEAGQAPTLGAIRQHLGAKGFTTDLGGGVTLGEYLSRAMAHYGPPSGLGASAAMLRDLWGSRSPRPCRHHRGDALESSHFSSDRLRQAILGRRLRQQVSPMVRSGGASAWLGARAPQSRRGATGRAGRYSREIMAITGHHAARG